MQHYELILTLLSAVILSTTVAVLVQRWRDNRPCKHEVTIKLSSIQKQKCTDCGVMLSWPLKDGQQPLVSSNRDKRSK